MGTIIIHGGKKFDTDTRARNIYGDFCKFLDESKPDEICIERSIYLQSFPATRSISEVIGLCKLAAGQRNIPFTMIHASSWKKGTVGKGNASKKEILDFVREKYKIEYEITQDEADSILIGEYFLKSKKNTVD
jgi:Holliday junction resolvasome RuvABC endonuclease subunit